MKRNKGAGVVVEMLDIEEKRRRKGIYEKAVEELMETETRKQEMS